MPENRPNAVPIVVESGDISERHLKQVALPGFADLNAPKIVFIGAGRSYRPIGGVKIILQHVAALRAAGFNAYLLNDSGFPVWIDDPLVRTHARVIASSHCAIRGHDALVISESVNDAILNTIKDWQATKGFSPKTRWGCGRMTAVGSRGRWLISRLTLLRPSSSPGLCAKSSTGRTWL